MSLKEIVVIGSLHYDIFLESPDLPRIGETIKGKDWHPKLGGKGRCLLYTSPSPRD